MLVDLRGQRQRVRVARGDAPHQRLNVGREKRRWHALAGDVRHGEERPAVLQFDDVEVIAADDAGRCVAVVDVVARQDNLRVRMQRVLNAARGGQIGLHLCF